MDVKRGVLDQSILINKEYFGGDYFWCNYYEFI